MSRPKAVITGALGQDGVYLAQQLLASGHDVIGLVESTGSSNTWRLKKLELAENSNLKIVSLDITNSSEVMKFVAETRPSLVFNLASHSFVQDAEKNPQNTLMVSGTATVNFLNAIAERSPQTRFLQASSSEMFGNAAQSPQSETTEFSPRSLYGTVKLMSHWATVNYRESAEIFASSLILYNHESPLRAEQYVTRKITKAAAWISRGLAQEVQTGNLNAVRDWGYAPEYVTAMQKTLSHDQPDIFVIASGRTTSVREFATWAFSAAGMEIAFEGSGTSEVGVDKASGRVLLSVNKEYYRPDETTTLVGDSAKASEILDWRATTNASQIAQLMVEDEFSTLNLQEN
jgi:GDPmannose 4,6-dehydratase